MENMENNEIMTTEEFEVIDVTDEIVEVETESSGNGLKAVVGVGIAAGLGYLGYRFIVKPIKAKFKAKKEQTVEAEAVEVIEEPSVQENDNDPKEDVKPSGKKK